MVFPLIKNWKTSAKLSYAFKNLIYNGMDYPPFFRKYSLTKLATQDVKGCVLASIESLKSNGGFMDYDDRGEGKNQISIR